MVASPLLGSWRGRQTRTVGTGRQDRRPGVSRATKGWRGGRKPAKGKKSDTLIPPMEKKLEVARWSSQVVISQVELARPVQGPAGDMGSSMGEVRLRGRHSLQVGMLSAVSLAKAGQAAPGSSAVERAHLVRGAWQISPSHRGDSRVCWRQSP